MDDLEHELRELLTNERRALSPHLVSLDAVHAGATRRRRRRAAVVASVTGVVVVALAGTAALAGLGGLNGLRDNRGGTVAATSEGTVPTSSGEPEPSDNNASTDDTHTIASPALAWGAARVLSVTATSVRTFVTLGELGDTGSCSSAGCLRLAESHNGGITFNALPVPDGATGEGPDGATASSVTQVRFGSAKDGWLYGGGLWSTHDGGESWVHLSLPGQVTRLESAGGSAWALVADSSRGSSSDINDMQHLYRAPVGSDTWTKVDRVAVSGPSGLVVESARVVVMGANESRLWVGDESGLTEHPSPCPGALAVMLSATSSVWASCATGTLTHLVTSPDGLTWTPVLPSGAVTEFPNSAALGARNDDEAFVGQGVDPTLVRVDTSGSATTVTAPPTAGKSLSYIGFTTGTVGYAIDGASLWRTDDGGDSWRKLALESTP